MSSSSDLAISIRGLSKSYTIAHGALKRPSFREVCMERLRHPFRRPQTETFWALKDVSFDVKRGEVVGIIGRNGAGKSTLLKILSRITEPTAGEIDVYGRIGSLLEVGTGFHPELTGRENVYLNGAILGMTRAEIRKQFDAIVDFAEIEKFLDTPVKRYSSGMYVRLAFAVAAHLDPEILVVDEVLAVGDAAFQKKCLGKMKDAAGQGRTVLFVSHNMTAVGTLCTSAIWLSAGQLCELGRTNDVIDAYRDAGQASASEVNFDSTATSPGNTAVRLKHVSVRMDQDRESAIEDRDAGEAEIIDYRRPLRFDIEFWSLLPEAVLHVTLVVHNADDVCVFASTSRPQQQRAGVVRTTCRVPAELLNTGSYRVQILIVRDEATPVFDFGQVATFEIVESQRDIAWHGRWPGVVRPRLAWETRPEECDPRHSSATGNVVYRVSAS